MSQTHTVEFVQGDLPDVPLGQMKSFLVAHRSPHDGKVRTFAAWYLNGHPLEHQDPPCPQCPGEDCPGESDGMCPVTGWFYDESNFEYDNCYWALSDEVIAWAPIPQFEDAPRDKEG